MKSAALIGWAALLWAGAAHAYCPCYTLSSPQNRYGCGVEAQSGVNPTLAEWQPMFALASRGPSAWGSSGPSVPDIAQGCGKPQPQTPTAARFPCELLKGIAMQESGWKQFCPPDVPADQVGTGSRTLISYDCGYGIGQVTSGMYLGDAPSFDRLRVANDPMYNLATGTRILASKWSATACVGDNQPTVIEHWYAATWAYNGLAYVNNPNNPVHPSPRGVWDPQLGGSAPYQEKVFGWIEHPPSAEHWTSVALAYPDPAEVGGAGAPGDLSEPACASPTDCAGRRAVHVTGCADPTSPPEPSAPDAGEAAPPGESGTTPPAPPSATERSAATRVVVGGCGCGPGSGAGPLSLLVCMGAVRRRRQS